MEFRMLGFKVPLLSQGNGGMSGPAGKGDRVKDGKDECPVFWVSENGSYSR